MFINNNNNTNHTLPYYGILGNVITFVFKQMRAFIYVVTPQLNEYFLFRYIKFLKIDGEIMKRNADY